MPLIKNGRVIADRYVNVLDDAPLPDGVPVIVPAALTSATNGPSSLC